MAADIEKAIGPGVKRPIILSPWVVALAALALYGLTLNHWVTFGSIPYASQITGWDWHPGPLPWRPKLQYEPLFLILTYPLRGLPSGWRVMGLNVLTAVCAALTLAILARSVKLLPHERAKRHGRRERAESASETVHATFLPDAFAVLLLAGQLTFWENAISGTGEMLNLLVFAFLICCLLEFHNSQKERWLNLFGLVYGAGVANSWALIGFFPCFLLALIWMRRLSFFEYRGEDSGAFRALIWIKHIILLNWRFTLRIIGCGALGLLLYGLIPLLGTVAHDGRFLELLHQKLGEQHFFLTRLPRYFAVISGVTTLVPLCFAAIDWRSCRRDMSPGADLTRTLFRVLNLVFLAVGILMFFEVKFSPNPRTMGMGVIAGTPGFLSFYYLAALGVGYFTGHVPRMFWIAPSRRKRNRTISYFINRGVVGLLWVAAIGFPAVLYWDNYPRIRDLNSPVVAQFGKEMAKSMPAEPAVVLADDPARLYLAMGARQSLDLPDHYIFVESRSLVHREYLLYLADHYPIFGKALVNRNRLPEQITDQQASELLAHLVLQEPVYYLHPSFGSQLERVCMTPHRLGGYLHLYPTNVLETLALSAGAIATNQAYWHTLEKESLASLPKLAKGSADARQIAGYYSQILDYWGTELQKIGMRRKLPELVEDANNQFVEAVRLNPNNVLARANQQYNAHLRAAPPLGPLVAVSDVAAQFYNRWDLALNADGPADVPDLDIQIGRYFAQRGAYLQAAPLFQRSLELAPNDPVGELDLANTYIDMGLVDAAFALIRDMREHSKGDPLELAGVEALAYLARNNFAQADQLLDDAHSKNPKDAKFSGVMAEFYRLMGNRMLREGKGDAVKEKDAAQWFRKSLTALDAQLQLLDVPTANPQEVNLVNLHRAEMQMAIRDYGTAIITLTTLAQQDPINPAPLLNRAISEVRMNRLNAAKDDFQAVERMMPEPSPAVYYGLAQIAQRQNDKPAEIRYAKLYLRYAPRNTLEFTNATQQVRKLEGH
jgi:tetratricopeptide (TPR) repeat protein